MICACCGVDLTKVPPTWRLTDGNLYACTPVCLSQAQQLLFRKTYMAHLWACYFKKVPWALETIETGRVPIESIAKDMQDKKNA